MLLQKDCLMNFYGIKVEELVMRCGLDIVKYRYMKN